MKGGAEFSAVVLAGGKSSRMGQPKCALPFGGVTILERVVEQLKREFADVVIVAAPRDSEPHQIAIPGVTLLHDETPFGGPVDAVARGLRAVRRQIAFACSCDLPMLDSAVARKLCEMLSDEDALIPQVGGRYQPLHAAYRARCAQALSRMSASGERRLAAIMGLVNVRVLAEAAVRKLDPGLGSFLNVNTPEDYQRALRFAKLR